MPVDGSEPLEWRLLTTLSVRDAAAEQVLHYYRRRWRIEDWHRILKSGCKAEFLNRQSAERRQRAIAIKGVIAWRLQAMVLLGRETPELPAEVWFSDLEIRVRQDVARQRQRLPPEDLGSAVLLMVTLGGYMARKHDPPPGHQILWRGSTILEHYTQAYEWFLATDPERFYPNLRSDRTCV